jgi:signal transduction histidine kinase/ActR/RegA family two-component response regulator
VTVDFGQGQSPVALVGVTDIGRALTRDELDHLANDRSLIVSYPAEDLRGRCYLVRSLDDGLRRNHVIWGRIDIEYLWGIGTKNTLPPRTELCVFDSDNRALVRSSSIPVDFGSTVARSLQSGAPRWFEWRTEDTRFLAGSWKIPMETNYLTGAWTVVLSERRSDVLEAVDDFRREFPLLVLATLWLVLLVSIVQIRRSLDPLQRLREGARRLGQRDFSRPVEVTSRDEFSELADAFNRMADRLGRHFDVLSTLESMGRQALASADGAAVVREVLPTLGRLLRCRRISIARVHPASAETTVFTSEATDGDHHIAQVTILHGVTEATAGPQSAAVAAPHDAHADPSTLVHPLIADGETIGVLTIEGVDPVEDEDARSLAGEISEQLALVLHQTRLRGTLEAERQRLSRLLEYLPSGVILLDPERSILLANQIARECLSVLTEAHVGDRLDELGGRPIDSLMVSDSGRFLELRFDDAGTPRLFEVAAGHLTVGDAAESTAIVLREITREREIELQMQRQERLAAVGRLTAGISHDFNNILQGITMAGDLLKLSDGVPEPLRRVADDVSREAHRGARMIRQILDFSRRAVASRRPVDLGDALEETVTFLRGTLPENVILQYSREPEKLVTLAEPTQLQQVFMNLAVNARDAMPGGGRLTITLEAIEVPPEGTRPVAQMEAGNWLRVTFVDDGEGIPVEIQKKIFEPFFTTKAEGEGTGLGLAQVFGIVRQHGGYVDFSSQIGRGTSFRLYLPQILEAARETVIDTADGRIPRGDGERVMVVENNEMLLRHTVANLTDLGYRVTAAATGDEALRAIVNENPAPQVVVSDIIMPGRSGLELLDELMRLPAGPKVILVSGHVTDEEINAARRLGAIDVLRKPFNLIDLATAIAAALASESN